MESPVAALRLRTDAAKRYKRVDRATSVIWRLLGRLLRESASLAIEGSRNKEYLRGSFGLLELAHIEDFANL